MTSEQTIDYETLAQDAMRGVVRTVLTKTAKSGLPGDHHFYISFDTDAPGVSLSKRLREKYPREMTIVLQHRFWDLIVTEDRFEVKLTFDGIPERLVVPFEAIKVFFDPSVRYGLQFEDPDTGPDASEQSLATGALAHGQSIRPTTTRSSSPRKLRTPRKPKVEREAGEATAADSGATFAPANKSNGHAAPAGAAATIPAPKDGDKPAPPPGGAQVVSLSDFRKK